MNWLKENPFVSGLAFVTVVACGALGFFLSGLVGSFNEASTGYASAVQELQGLQNRVPFPDAGNLKKAQESLGAYRSEIDAFRSSLASMQVAINPAVTPQEFQDNLRASVNEVSASAQTAKVKLPDNFYLGFDRYRDTPPAQGAAPALQRQLDVVKRIVVDLVGPKPENPGIRSLDGLVRQELPEESGAPAGSAPDAKGGKGKEAGPSISAPAKYPFVVSFTTEQGKLRVALNSIVRSNPFLILRTLSIVNTSPEGPKVAAEQKPEAPASQNIADIFSAAGNSGNKAPSKEKLNVILGRELVKTTAKIEMVDFRFPPAKPEPSPSK